VKAKRTLAPRRARNTKATRELQDLVAVMRELKGRDLEGYRTLMRLARAVEKKSP